MTDTTTTVTSVDPAARMPRWTDYIDVEALVPDPRNPKNHADDDLDGSLERWGYTEQVLIDERTGMLSAGHGRRELVLRAKARHDNPVEGEELPEVPDGIIVDADGRWLMPVQRGWSSANDVEALAYLVASNRLTEKGGWDQAAHVAALEQVVAESAAGLEGVGYTPAEYEALIAEAQAAEVDPEKSALLAAADVTVGEPQHRVAKGDGYTLTTESGIVHRLECVDLMTGHDRWAQHLGPGVLFLPYPGPFITLAARFDSTPTLMVQPEPYLAGHILDKWAALRGEAGIVKASA